MKVSEMFEGENSSLKKTYDKATAEEFADTIINRTTKDNPKEIIKWAKSEIKAYQDLIKILEKKCKNKLNK